jgi:hypothetical protein
MSATPPLWAEAGAQWCSAASFGAAFWCRLPRRSTHKPRATHLIAETVEGYWHE